MIIEIEREIRERGITRLCHFVPTNKLLHILNSEEGIKAVDFINKDVLVQNDTKRLDGRTDCINCSIQYPNYWYYRAIEKKNSIFPDWAVIFINPIVATYEATEFCPVNAAKKNGKFIGKGYENFKLIFADDVNGYKRNSYMLMNVPTNDQAEVLVQGNIPRKLITGIAFKDEEIARQKVAEWSVLNVPKIDVYVAPDLFDGTASNKIRKGIMPVEKLYVEEK